MSIYYPEKNVERLNDKCYSRDAECIRPSGLDGLPSFWSLHDLVGSDFFCHHLQGMTSSQLPHRINRARPLDPGLDPLNRNQQMKSMGPEGIHHGPYLNFPENIVPYNNPHHGSDPRINPAAYNLMLQQMPIPGNFPQQVFLQGLPRGVPLSHPMNHMQGYIPKISNVHNMSLHHQQPNYDGLGMGMQGKVSTTLRVFPIGLVH